MTLSIKDASSITQSLVTTTDSTGFIHTPHNNAQLYVNGAAVTASNAVPVLGNLAIQVAGVALSATNRLPVDGSGVTQPISAVALPLPSGASSFYMQQQILNQLGSPLQTNGPVSINQTSDTTSNNVSISPSTNTTLIISTAATTNTTSVKAGPGTVKSISGFNTATSPRFLKFYNTASIPTVGTSSIYKIFYLAPSANFKFDFPAGAYFSGGIAFGLTVNAAANDATALAAGDVICLNVDYR